jgi:transposase-like protein
MTYLNSAIPDPEVPSARPRKRYSKAFKLRILAEAEAAVGPGEVAALLRREGMYSSTLADFRDQRSKGKLSGSNAQSAPAPVRSESQVRQVARLEREVRGLRRDLRRATLVIDVQKKVSELLGITLTDVTDDQDSQ